jgi:hypothetical protein
MTEDQLWLARGESYEHCAVSVVAQQGSHGMWLLLHTLKILQNLPLG